MSFKSMLSLPKNTANSVLEYIFEDLDSTILSSDNKVETKIQLTYIEPIQKSLKNLNYIPENFLELFYFQ